MMMAEIQHFLPPQQQLQVKSLKPGQKEAQQKMREANEQRAKAMLLALRAHLDAIVEEA